jgi:hypothetical protein
MKLEDQRRFDYIGILLSTICGLHCIITPLLIISAPSLGKGLESIWVHSALITLMLYAFHQSIYKHFKLHRSILTLSLGCTGLILILISYFKEVFLHEEHHHHLEPHGTHDQSIMFYVAITGALLLIISHIFNIRKCRC